MPVAGPSVSHPAEAVGAAERNLCRCRWWDGERLQSCRSFPACSKMFATVAQKACETNHTASCSWGEADAPAIKEHASPKMLCQAGRWAHAEAKVGTDSRRRMQTHLSTAQCGCPNAPAGLLPGRDEAACVLGTRRVPGRSACCLQTHIFGAATPKRLFFAAQWWRLP